MIRTILFAAALLAASPALAEAFPNANPAKGKTLMQEAKCSACHVSMFGGDGSKIYTRPDRRVKSAEQLLSQVRFCATQVKANWFPEEERDVAAYLNQQYYHFK
ncbi:MAG TPA: cytochrome c [Pelomicrobium sp.]|nr:cytochrome c [Pelomicrobium sp.]